MLYPISAGSRPGEEGMPSLATLFIVNPEKLFKQILHADTGLGQSEEVMLVDRNRTILSPLKYPLAGNKEAAPLEYRVDSKSAELAALGIDGIVFGEDYTGEPVIAAVRHVRLTSDFGLGMIVKINEGEILAVARQSLKQSFLVSGLGLLLVLLLVYLFSGRITHPVIRLRRTAEKIIEGDLSARASVKTRDEVGYLAASFNAMVEEIQKWNEELETKVRERTAELSLELTERKLAEAALRESEREFRSLAEAMPQIVWATRSDGWNIYFNQQWVDYTGLTLEESYGHGWNIPFHPDDRQRAMDAWQQATATEGIYSLECRLRRSDGVYRWWLIRGVPVHNAEGKILKWFGTCTDIDDIKMAAEKVLMSSMQLEAALASMSDAVFISDTEGRFIEFNDAFATFHKFRNKEECAKTFAEYPEILDVFTSDGELAPVEQWAVPRALRGETATNAEYALRRKDTGETWVGNYTLAPIRNKDGMIVGSVVSGRDITEQKKAEEELRKYRDHLQDLVKERTLELEEAQEAMVSIVEDLNEKGVQLAQAMEQAQSADRLKSAFLATMSHELRTPLNSIIGFTGIVLQGMSGPLNEEQAKQLTMVKGSANHLLNLINDVLDISKIEAGQVQTARKSFDMRSVIEAALRSVMPLAAKKGLSLDCVIASDVGVIISDRRRVEQILINLIGNAVKFTERGAVRIECRTSEGRLETWVRDTGIGIKAEDVGKLFIPFSQIDTGLTRSHEGTGLGLSICGKLVEMLGGTIRVESEWGKGSKFIFTLPLT
jgi:PAS domain S-box-containing protein